MPAPLSSDSYAELVAAISDQDAVAIKSLLASGEFILINVQSPEDEDDEDAIGALTAELEDQEVLVVFSSEEHAGIFVTAQSDMFDEDEEVQGFMVEGDLLMDYLPEEFGLLLNPESDDVQLIPADLADELRDEDEAAE